MIIDRKNQENKKTMESIDKIKNILIKPLHKELNKGDYSSDIILSALINLSIEFYIQIGIVKDTPLERIKELLFKVFKDTEEMQFHIEDYHKYLSAKYDNYMKKNGNGSSTT